MDIRRLYSSPLTETGGESALSAASGQVDVLSLFGSPKASSTRVPAFWKNIKSKLVSLSISRSATNLTNLQYQTARSTAALSPAPQPTGSGACSAIHPHTSSSQRLFLPMPMECGLSARVQSDGVPVAAASTSACKAQPEASAGSSPIAIEKSTSVLSTDSDSVPEQPFSPARSEPPEVATPSSCGDHGNNSATLQAVPTTKLLSVSPALPAAMARPVWRLNDYTITKRLFKGTSSGVYKATCRRSGLPVALKVYFLSRVPVNVVHMLKREIEIHSQLAHKHVVHLYGSFMEDGERVVLVQELAVRGDLYGILQRLGGRMASEQVAQLVMRPFLEALAYMHSRGICHRDIKPENVLFTGSWRLVVADFGVSIDLHQERAVTRAGTQGYMAPEVERCPLKAQPDENKDDPRYAYSTAADIWAVGVLAYELMVGFPPVVLPRAGAAAGAGEVSGFVRCHMTASELHFPASVPAAARSLISAALAAEPQDRPTAAQMLQHPWLRPSPQSVPETTATGMPLGHGQAHVHTPAINRSGFGQDGDVRKETAALPVLRHRGGGSTTVLSGSAPPVASRLFGSLAT